MGVREPVGRAISAFFQVGESFGLIDPSISSEDLDVARLAQSFCDFYWTRARRDWFDVEFRAATDINVYDSYFPTEAGFAEYQSGRFRALLVRYEDLRRVAASAVGDFLGCAQPLQLRNVNVGLEKSYSHLYRRFVNDVELPLSLLADAYSSRQALHFYSPREIATMRQRWERRN